MPRSRMSECTSGLHGSRRAHAAPHHRYLRSSHVFLRAVDHPGMPNLSTHMPKPLEKKVLPNGIRTVPPSAQSR